MKRAIVATVMLAVCAPVALPSAALAQDHRDRRWDGDRDSDWDPANHYDDRRSRERRLRDDDRV